MSKVVVKTSGSFDLIDPTTKTEILVGQWVLVERTNFVNQRMGLGHLTAKSDDFPLEASNAAFQEILKASDGDVDLAIAAYKSELEPKQEIETPKPQIPQPEKRGRGRPRDS